MKARIGKSRIDVSVKGCYYCGALWSSGWYEFKEIPVQIGDSIASVTVHICEECEKRKNEKRKGKGDVK